MKFKYAVRDIQKTIASRQLPTITMWNRQEGRPRTDNFNRALKAEIRDALWMLTKQWQLGEFEGDDAGTPVLAKVHITTSGLNQYQPANNNYRDMNDKIPLETLVEQKAIPMKKNEHLLHLDLRLQLGRHWMKLLKTIVNDYSSAYRNKYKFQLPQQGERESDFVYAHIEIWQQYAAIASRAMDGYELYFHLASNPAHKASDGIVLLQPNDGPKLDQLGDEFISWYEALYTQPDQTEHAWLPANIEYRFATSVKESEDNNESFISKEYYHGAPDWYVFDKNEQNVPATDNALKQNTPHTFSLLPAPIVFDGMPDTRWWSFEDRKTNFGEVKPDTTDLAKLLFLEFGLIYANDWFVIPFRLPINSVANIRGIAVTNTFNETIWIKPSGFGQNQIWHKWEMFTLANPTQSKRSVPQLILPALTVKTQEGDPLEEVHFIRDEMANMVWAIESTVPYLNGYGRGGKETAEETLDYHKRMVAALGFVPDDLPYNENAVISYLAMTDVPEHWIPFLPVHIEGQNREVQLQRAKMLRIINGDTTEPSRIEPLSSLLREGLDQVNKQPYFIFEEEILRSGVIISQQFQRTRWTNGQVYTWFGTRKRTGRGEGSSGLAFDQIKDV